MLQRLLLECGGALVIATVWNVPRADMARTLPPNIFGFVNLVLLDFYFISRSKHQG